jgi:hypothetical protein
MAKLVTAFLQTLGPDQQAQAVFPYGSDERLNWHYTPRLSSQINPSAIF